MGDAVSPVCGAYDNIEVTPTTCKHSGQTLNIYWINEYAFYFKFCEGNEQIWIFDTEKNCLYQVGTDVSPGVLGRRNKKYGDALDSSFGPDPDSLGQFGDPAFTVYNTYGDFGTSYPNQPIVWVNPMCFYSKFAEGNEQFMVKDPVKDAYLQLGCGGSSVHCAFSGTKNFHKRR